MKEGVERLLYIALALIVAAVGIAIFVLFIQLHQLQAVTQTRLQTIDQINKAVSDIEANSKKNTDLIECLINLHAQGVVITPTSCMVIENQNPPVSQQEDSGSHGSTNQPASASNATPANPSPQPPTTNPGLIQGIINSIRGILN